MRIKKKKDTPKMFKNQTLIIVLHHYLLTMLCASHITFLCHVIQFTYKHKKKVLYVLFYTVQSVYEVKGKYNRKLSENSKLACVACEIKKKSFVGVQKKFLATELKNVLY